MKQQQFDSRIARAKDVALYLAMAGCAFSLGVIVCLIVQDFGAAVLA